MSRPDVLIAASGGANIASLQFALQRLGAHAEVSADAARIREASHVILPGVGAAADAMARLDRSGLAALIPQLTQPVLGICLGMQLLFEASEEGDTRCLGIIPGRAARFVEAPGRPVPQGLSHEGSPSLAFFHNAKSSGSLFFSPGETLAPISILSRS